MNADGKKKGKINEMQQTILMMNDINRSFIARLLVSFVLSCIQTAI